jgi:DNA-binding transcriptional MerR regulator
MISIEPHVEPAARYSIRETCELLEIHRHTLRAYTVQGFIRCGFRRATQRKFYLGSEILRLWRAQL